MMSLSDRLPAVVNVKVAHIRPEFADLSDWMRAPGCVYVGRARVVFINGVRFPPEDSPWCNPYRVNAIGLTECLLRYREKLRAQLQDAATREAFLKLAGAKQLGCWCVSKRKKLIDIDPAKLECHAEVILLVLAEYNSEQIRD